MRQIATRKKVRILIIFSVSALCLFLLLVYFLAIKPAKEAIQEARLALEGEPLDFERNVIDLSVSVPSSIVSKRLNIKCLSSIRELGPAALYDKKIYIASSGGLIVVNSGKFKPKEDLPNAFIKESLIEPAFQSKDMDSRIEPQERRRLRRMIESSKGTGLEKLKKDSDFYVENLLNIEHGLPENKITAIALCNNRLLIGYQSSGVSVFDGSYLYNYKFRNTRYNNISAIASNGITGKILTKTADLIETDGEVFRLMKNEIVGSQKIIITSMGIDKEGILIGTENSGIIHYGFNKTDTEKNNDILKCRINQFALTDDRLYIATDYGLYQRSSSNKYIKLSGDTPASAVAVASDGTLFCGSYFSEIIKITPKLPPELVRIPAGSEPVKSIVPLDDNPHQGGFGSAILVTDSALFRINRDKKIRKIGIGSSENYISSNFITALEKDDYGRIWVGYFEKGIDVLNPDLSPILHLENDDVRVIRHLKFDHKRGTMYAATSRGVIIINKQFRYNKIDNKYGLINNEVSHIGFTQQGNVYCTAGGLTFDRGGLLYSLYVFHNLCNNHTYCSVSADGRLLIGTLGGISIIKDMRVQENLTPLNSPLPNNWVTALLADEDGKIWVGTYGSGLACIRADGKWEKINCPFRNVEINNNAIILYQDMLLAGTLSDGIIIYDLKEREWRVYQHPLPSRNVTAFLPSGEEILVGTDSGLVVINKDLFKYD